MTNDELNRKVMEAMGYVIRQLAERDPGGAIHRYRGWVDPELDINIRCKDYKNSMDACMELLEDLTEDEIGWSLQSDGEDGYMFILYFDDDKTWQVFGDTMAEAVCKGFLEYDAWKEEQ